MDAASGTAMTPVPVRSDAYVPCPTRNRLRALRLQSGRLAVGLGPRVSVRPAR